MNRILEIDEENLTATVQPGVITQDMIRAVEQKGLFYPPDPSSMKISTIGGNINENSGGLRGLKYGVTRDYVLGLEAVLASGDVIRTGGKLTKDVVGYDLTRLFVGSEGTLGVVTEATLKLVPKPETKKRCSHSMNILKRLQNRFLPSSLKKSFRPHSNFWISRHCRSLKITPRSGFRQTQKPYC